jgi:hypothetical protein
MCVHVEYAPRSHSAVVVSVQLLSDAYADSRALPPQTQRYVRRLERLGHRQGRGSGGGGGGVELFASSKSVGYEEATVEQVLAAVLPVRCVDLVARAHARRHAECRSPARRC